ncbi:MAG: hypothetical protein EZS28_004924 [Streblomastix strix]|uniref:Uncharacterized protein n=1 Tax=Streblomastix strix TaxID=222440 RepID=A0A5J4WWW0_9EUKA|nr:MAG: hypothetical protein EZS28_004924 [Streblomastix strix]
MMESFAQYQAMIQQIGTQGHQSRTSGGPMTGYKFQAPPLMSFLNASPPQNVPLNMKIQQRGGFNVVATGNLEFGDLSKKHVSNANVGSGIANVNTTTTNNNITTTMIPINASSLKHPLQKLLQSPGSTEKKIDSDKT